MKHYHVNARRWFERTNGNTYHSVTVTFPDGTVKVAPFQYGYGEHYRQTAFEMITGLKSSENGRPIVDWQYYKEHKMQVSFDCVDVNRRKDLHGGN